MTRTYKIDQRPTEFGGGWNLKLYEDGEEMGGGVFSPEPTAEDASDLEAAHEDAMEQGEVWLHQAKPKE